MKKILVIGALILILIVGYLGVSQGLLLKKAHSTFENYAAFRGCTKIIKRTDHYGQCLLPSGKTITIVEFRGKWYLQNDLPFCLGSFCL